MGGALLISEKPFNQSVLDRAVETFQRSKIEVKVLEKYTTESLLEAVGQAEYLIVRSDKVDQKLIDAATQLKLIVRAGAGYDTIDHAYAESRGIIVENTPGQNARSVAQLVFSLLYNAARPIDGNMGREIGGKFGFLGGGAIGLETAAIAQGHGFDVSVYDPNFTDEKIRELTARGYSVFSEGSLNQIFDGADIVSLHI